MAWRIHDSVVRGEIDNRQKGVVTGRIWIHGLAEPVALQLQGNAHPDLAGCLLQFENPGQTCPLRANSRLFTPQSGTIGDLTASRKVRVFDVPFEEAREMLHRGEKPPEHMANSLYLEWFSEANGRVVIESSDYRLNISEPSWRLSAEEDEQRAQLAAQGFAGFLDKLSEAVEAQRHNPSEDREWDEFDYEKFLREGDALTDKYGELLDKYGDSPEAEEIIAREMGWHEDPDDDDDDDDEEEADDGWKDANEINRAIDEAADEPLVPDPETEGVDWIRTEDDDIRHPLQHRCFESAMKLWSKCDDLGVSESDDADITQFIGEFQITAAKLAGALNNLAYDRDLMEGAFVVACLKRALSHLHNSQAGLEKVAGRKLLPPDLIEANRQELFEIREGILRLMDEFRGRNT